jgi:hypothetical protein
MPKVNLRLTVVLPIAVTSRLIALAACAVITPRNSRYIRTKATVLATPTTTKRTSWLATTPGRPLGPPRRHRASADSPGGDGLPSAGTLMLPLASPVPRRMMPRMSARAVLTTLTRESGSSIQSTGTSWIPRPARSASTSSSVSKNQPRSAVSGSSCRAAPARIALKPHWASENRVPSVACRSRL